MSSISINDMYNESRFVIELYGDGSGGALRLPGDFTHTIFDSDGIVRLRDFLASSIPPTPVVNPDDLPVVGGKTFSWFSVSGLTEAAFDGPGFQYGVNGPVFATEVEAERYGFRLLSRGDTSFTTGKATYYPHNRTASIRKVWYVK